MAEPFDGALAARLITDAASLMAELLDEGEEIRAAYAAVGAAEMRAARLEQFHADQKKLLGYVRDAIDRRDPELVRAGVVAFERLIRAEFERREEEFFR